MKYISTRYIDGNRGDLLSRYGILSGLQELGLLDEVAVMALRPEHTAGLNCWKLPYGRLYNTFLPRSSWPYFRKSKAVIWTGGLDLCDDSSILKLAYLLFNFVLYRILGLEIIVLNQGAGPVRTRLGMFLVKAVLRRVKTFVARDEGSFQLLGNIAPRLDLRLSFDGIFAGTFHPRKPDVPRLNEFFRNAEGRMVIGVNIRQWFHFSCSILPNHLKRGVSRKDLDWRMRKFLECSIESVKEIRARYNAKVILISAYEFNSSPSNDELPFLIRMKEMLKDDDDVMVTDFPLTLSEYLFLISKLDLMIGTRLHCALAALRMNVPAINLNYTLKGRDIFRDLGLSEYIVELVDYIEKPSLLLEKIDLLIEDKTIREKIRERVNQAVQANHSMYESLLSVDS